MRFREKIRDTAAELRLIRDDIKGIYDQDLTITNPQRPQNISVTGLDRSIRNRNRNDHGDLNESFTDLYDRSNADLDELKTLWIDVLWVSPIVVMCPRFTTTTLT